MESLAHGRSADHLQTRGLVHTPRVILRWNVWSQMSVFKAYFTQRSDLCSTAAAQNERKVRLQGRFQLLENIWFPGGELVAGAHSRRSPVTGQSSFGKSYGSAAVAVVTVNLDQEPQVQIQLRPPNFSFWFLASLSRGVCSSAGLVFSLIRPAENLRSWFWGVCRHRPSVPDEDAWTG